LGIRSSNDATRINCCRLALIFSMVNLLDWSDWSRSSSSFSISAFHTVNMKIKQPQ
jgi:hypothetical protein